MTNPATKPCEFCHNGSVIDSNGAAWRCAHCNGSGVVPERVHTRHAEPCHTGGKPAADFEEVEW